MKRFLTSAIETLPGFKSIFDYYTALRIAGWAAFTRADEVATDGLPIPTPLLLVSTTGTADVSVYLESGKLAQESIQQTLDNQHRDMKAMGCILDFGCGCGRVLRQWHNLQGLAIHGVDIDHRAVKWCRKHLPFAHVSTCTSEPPLEYVNEYFDMIYALSVLTHLTEDRQKAWVEEWHRILKPNGVLMFSLHGSFYRDTLSEEEKTTFDAGGVVVRNPNSSGTNRCGTYHSLSYVTGRLAAGYELLQHIPCGARGNPEQDLYIFCKSAR